MKQAYSPLPATPEHNLATCIVAGLGSDPARIVLSFEGVDLSAGELTGRIVRYRAWLQTLAIGKGDIAALYLENEPDWLAVFYALISLGAAVMPINPALNPNEVKRILQIGRPVAIVSRDGQCDALDLGGDAGWQPRTATLEQASKADPAPAGPLEIAAVAADNPAVIFFTSGSSGEPKGVVCSHAHEQWAIARNIDNWGIGSGDTTLVGLPLAFVFGSIMTATTTLVAGGRVSLLRRFHPEEAIKACRRGSVTVLPGVPTMFAMLSQAAAAGLGGYRGLQWAFSGGDLLTDSAVESFRRHFDVPIFDIFGITEARPIAGYTRGQDAEPVLGTCGRLYPGIALRLVDDDGAPVAAGQSGELVVGGPAVASGYFRNEAATREAFRDGEFWSGDLACLSPEGYLRIVGRKKAVIKRGGMMIAPAEIEQCLAQHPSVQAVAVIPRPDPLFGHELAAVVVRENQIDEAELRTFCAQHLAKYKIPKWIVFRSDLPKGPTGKIDRKILAIELDAALPGGPA